MQHAGTSHIIILRFKVCLEHTSPAATCQSNPSSLGHSSKQKSAKVAVSRYVHMDAHTIGVRAWWEIGWAHGTDGRWVCVGGVGVGVGCGCLWGSVTQQLLRSAVREGSGAPPKEPRARCQRGEHRTALRRHGGRGGSAQTAAPAPRRASSREGGDTTRAPQHEEGQSIHHHHLTP